MTCQMLILGGNGLLGRHLRFVAECRGWAPTVVAVHPDTGIRACPSERALADLVSSEIWDVVIDLRAFDVRSTRVVTHALNPGATLILVSSIYAYCHPGTNPERDLRALTENALQTPSGPYGPGKAAAEQEAFSSALQEVYAVRLPYVFGAGDRTERTQRFARFASAHDSSEDTRYEVGLVSAAVVAKRLIRLADRRTPDRRMLNLDGGCNWTLDEHLRAARRRHSSLVIDSAATELTFNPARDYSLNARAAHQLLQMDADDDLERQWHDVLGT